MRDAKPRAIRRAYAAHVLAVELDPASRRDHAGERAQRRGLAGAIGTEQRDDRAFLDREIDAVQHPDRAVAGMQAADLKCRHAASPR